MSAFASVDIFSFLAALRVLFATLLISVSYVFTLLVTAYTAVLSFLGFLPAPMLGFYVEMTGAALRISASRLNVGLLGFL